jgi:hypothetical protein
MSLGTKLTHERAMKSLSVLPNFIFRPAIVRQLVWACRVLVFYEDTPMLRLVECDNREFLFRPSFDVASLEVEAPVSPLRL